MDARDRKLLEATARGVEWLLREFETRQEPFKPKLKSCQEAREKLQKALEMPVQIPQKDLGPLPKDNTPKGPFSGRPLRERILLMITDYQSHGFTVDELEARLFARHQSVSARVRDLEKEGLICPNGLRETRSGRQAQVWIATKPEGKKNDANTQRTGQGARDSAPSALGQVRNALQPVPSPTAGPDDAKRFGFV